MNEATPIQPASDSPATNSPGLDRGSRRYDPMTRALPTLVVTALQLLWISASLALTILFTVVEDRHGLVFSNRLSPNARQLTLIGMLTGAALLLVGTAASVFVRPHRDKLSTAAKLARGLLPLAWLWPIPLFFDWRVFGGHGLLRVVLASLWGLGLERALRGSFEAFQSAPKQTAPTSTVSVWRKATRTYLPSAFVAALVVWFVAFCAKYTIVEHQRLGTAGFDLGLFDNLMFNLGHGEWFFATVDAGNNNGGNHLQYHANFLAYLFLPFYALAPGSEVLLVLQAVVVGLAAVPFFLLATRKLGNAWFGLAFAYLFLIHEGIQSPVFFEFHFLTLSPFFIGWTLYFFDRGSKVPLLIVWVLTLLLREDQGTILAGAALVYLMRGERPLWSLAMGLVGVIWLAAMRFVVMPLNGPPGGFHQHSGIFQGMIAPGSHGFGGVLKTLATNPPYSLENLLEGRKLEYVLALAAPFLLLPFRKRLLWVLFLPASLFTLVTTNYAPSVSTRFQYSMYWVSMLIFGCLVLLGDWKVVPRTRKHVTAAVLTMVIVGTALSYDGGGLFQHNTLVGGFRKIGFQLSASERSRYEELKELALEIPPQASVTATESLVPHVSTRRIIRTLRQGAFDSEYLLVWKDEVRGGEQSTALLNAFRSERWGVVKTTKNFQLWKMGAPSDNNRAAIRAVGLRP